MWNFFKILGILLFFQVYCYGQNDVTIEWKNDTAWYVNCNYDVTYAPEHVIDMPFPVFNGLNYQSYKVDWGDGDVDLVSSLLSVERKVRHTYVGQVCVVWKSHCVPMPMVQVLVLCIIKK